MSDIDPNHPRAESLRIRKRLVNGFERGLVTPEGLSAHGRGEAFDYILGERTTRWAKKAIEAGAAELLLAEKPVFSVNGNTAALVPEDIADLDEETDARIEVNLFHESGEREKEIADYLMEKGVSEVFGVEKKHSSEVPEVKSPRRIVDERGIDVADMVMVPLEDGDRTEALVNQGRTVVAIDLNPMSRTARAADVTIVDNIVRAMPLFVDRVGELREADGEEITEISENFNNEENLRGMLKLMLERLEKLSREE